MIKKLSACLLAIMMLVTLIPMSTFAALPDGVPSSLEAPTIEKIELKHDGDGVPYFEMQLKIPQSILDLDTAKPAGGSVFWDYSEKIDNGSWSEFGGGGYLSVITEADEGKVAGSDNTYIVTFEPIDEGSIEKIDIKDHIYSYKVIFYYDYYEGWPNIEAINSPASNEKFIGSGSFYSDASNWAKSNLQKASDMGLIPDILKGTDMTKPINREEFCELAILLYEKTTGDMPDNVANNPFTDTDNNQILKAYKMGITSGTSATTFSPKLLINRQECAVMLFHTIQAINPDGDYSIAGVKDFPDQKNISSWAVKAAKYMSKTGIISGDSDGKFMPRATTTADKAASYGMATREQAIVMSLKTYVNMK